MTSRQDGRAQQTACNAESGQRLRAMAVWEHSQCQPPASMFTSAWPTTTTCTCCLHPHPPLRPPVPHSVNHLCLTVSTTCASQCRPPVPHSDPHPPPPTHPCPPVGPAGAAQPDTRQSAASLPPPRFACTRWPARQVDLMALWSAGQAMASVWRNRGQRGYHQAASTPHLASWSSRSAGMLMRRVLTWQGSGGEEEGQQRCNIMRAFDMHLPQLRKPPCPTPCPQRDTPR
jgi:hypothetical protein